MKTNDSLYWTNIFYGCLTPISCRNLLFSKRFSEIRRTFVNAKHQSRNGGLEQRWLILEDNCGFPSLPLRGPLSDIRAVRGGGTNYRCS